MIHQNDPESPQPVAEAESLVGVASTDLLAVLVPYDKRTNSYEVRYKVHGFWGEDYVRVSTSDGWVSWSCGGRDPKEEASDATAAKCFALAVTDAARVAESILANAKADS